MFCRWLQRIRSDFTSLVRFYENFNGINHVQACVPVLKDRTVSVQILWLGLLSEDLMLFQSASR